MKKGALSKRLQKARKAKSVPIAVRLPREDVEQLDRIENQTDIRYDWLIRMLVRRLLHFWRQEKKIEVPLYVCVMTEEKARKLGLLDKEGSPTDVTWLSCTGKHKHRS